MTIRPAARPRALIAIGLASFAIWMVVDAAAGNGSRGAASGIPFIAVGLGFLVLAGRVAVARLVVDEETLHVFGIARSRRFQRDQIVAVTSSPFRGSSLLHLELSDHRKEKLPMALMGNAADVAALAKTLDAWLRAPKRTEAGANSRPPGGHPSGSD